MRGPESRMAKGPLLPVLPVLLQEVLLTVLDRWITPWAAEQVQERGFRYKVQAILHGLAL